MTKPTREELLAQPAKVRIDILDAPLLNGVSPVDDPRAYGMTDEEAEAFNERVKQNRTEQAKRTKA